MAPPACAKMCVFSFFAIQGNFLWYLVPGGRGFVHETHLFFKNKNKKTIKILFATFLRNFLGEKKNKKFRKRVFTGSLFYITIIHHPISSTPGTT